MRARIMLSKASFLCLNSSCKSLDIVPGIFQFFLLVFISFALQINVQTDSTDAHPSLPPPTKVLKNKALLCKPLVRNKGVSCKTQTAECGAQTGKSYPCLNLIVALAALLTSKNNKQSDKITFILVYYSFFFVLTAEPLLGSQGGGWSLCYLHKGRGHP